MCVCVCTRSCKSWTAAAMDFDIIFTNDRDKPSFILYFQAVPCSLSKCALPALPGYLPHVSLRRETRIAALQAGFPLFFHCGRRIPEPSQSPIPSAAPFSVTIFPPTASLSPLRQLAAPAPPLAGTQPWLLGPGRATKLGARGGEARVCACACRRAYTRNRPSLALGTRARAARAGRASTSTSTSALSALAPTRSRRGSGGTWRGRRCFPIGPNGTAGAGQLAS